MRTAIAEIRTISAGQSDAVAAARRCRLSWL
jgi:hypothetical protein